MKRTLVFFTLLFALSLSSSASGKYLTWFDGSQELRKRIDLEKNTLEVEDLPGKWRSLQSILSDSSVNVHLPPRISVHSFYLGKGIWRFTLAGTGIVFDFDEAKGMLSKTDRTYYAGYNFGASVFLRNGTLYSFGGSGFWDFSRALTFFDEQSKEWENIKADNIGPEAIFNGFHGYASKSDVFYSGGSEYHSFLNKQPTKIDEELYAFNFKTNRWNLLGIILPELLEAKSREIVWSGQYFIQFSGEVIYIIDPKNNKVFKYQSETHAYQPAPLMYLHNGTLYGYWDEEGGKRFSFAIADLLKQSTMIGSFYKAKSYLGYYVVAGLVLLLIVIGFNQRHKLQRKRNLNLDEQELSLLSALLAAPNGLTTIEVNDILGLSNKNLDNQRRLRLNIISNINHKIYLKFRLESTIVRTASTFDKRQNLYIIREDLIPMLKKNLE